MNTTSPSRSGDATRDRGFTLIELMVVVLIIAILLAIAIPTFLGAQNKAKDRSAQSSVRNTLTAAKTIFSDNGDYTDADKAALILVEPAFTFLNGAAGGDGDSTGPKEVSVYAPDANTFYATALSDTGKCYYIRDVVGAGGGTGFATVDAGAAACTGADAAALAAGWSADGW